MKISRNVPAGANRAARALLRTRPDRVAFARFLGSPSSYLLFAAVALTAGAKIFAAYKLETPYAWAIGLWAALPDTALYFGLAGLLAFVESKGPRLRFITWPIASCVFALSAANAAFLVIAGEQGSWDAIVNLSERYRETSLILDEALANGHVAWSLTLLVLALALPPCLARFGLRRLLSTRPGTPADNGRARAAVGAWVALPALLLALVVPHPSSLEAYRLGESALLSVASGAVESMPPGTFRSHGPDPVSEDELHALEAREKPDLLVVVLESVRFDHTSLAGARANAQTPNLLALAKRGFSAQETRAVLPHTTKSVFSVLCGKMPTMQRELIELDARAPVQCLPKVLEGAGYRTAFFQSSVGTFENRARLVERLGFGQFTSFEDLRGKRLGYLASEDASLVEPVLNFFAQARGKPSFATVLTSATHHPYRLSRALVARAKAQGQRYTEPADAYARLVEEADRMLGAIVEGLAARGRLDSTLVVVIGDHGEGFGQRGVRQHDNDFYEEGLRVPLAMAGPGITPGSHFDGNASLLDVTPTLLGELGVDFDRAALDGFDLRRDPPGAGRMRAFGCFRAQQCRGFVRGDEKVILRPKSGERFMFDLANDPEEKTALVVRRSRESEVNTLNDLIDAHRSADWKLQFRKMSRYDRWRCPSGRPGCRYLPDKRTAALEKTD